MEISHESMMLSAMIALRGSITPNLRSINVDFSNNHISLFFYYNEEFSEQEEGLSELIATSIISDFPDVALQGFSEKRIVLPFPKIIPNEGFCVYKRYEPYLPDCE